MKLYHYCCRHSANEILKTMTVLPNKGMMLKVGWFTDLDYPDRDALGLTSHMLDCDRASFRFTVTQHDLVVRWGQVRSHAPRAVVDALELAPGAYPAHWFVSPHPVAVQDFTLVKTLRP